MKKVSSATFKTLFSHLFIFCVLIGGYFFFIDDIVKAAVEHKAKCEVEDWIPDIQSLGSQSALIALIKAKITHHYAFQIIKSDGAVLFDSDSTQGHKNIQPSLIPLSHIEVPFCSDLGCYTISLRFNHKKVPLNIADVRWVYVGSGIGFAVVFIILSTTMLLLFSWPIQRLFRVINAYHLGKVEELPSALAHGRDEAAVFSNTLGALLTQVRDLETSLAEEKQRCHMILEALVEGIIAVDSHLNVTYANAAGAKMIGMPKGRLIDANLMRIKPKHPTMVTPKCQELLSAAVHQHTVRTDSVAIGKNSKVHLDIVAIPLGMERGAVLILQDNSAHHKVLTMGKEFIANASHELRTPITIVKGFAEMLHDLPKISDTMLKDITDKILRSCHRMSALVKNLLVLADLDTLPPGSLETREVAVILENCGHELHKLHPDVGLTLKLSDEQVCIHIDSGLIELAFMNLLENAVKYSSNKAEITVSVETTDEDVCISFADQGIGIPEKDIPHIFDRFYTVNKSHSRKLGGAGLGLSIVRTIIEKHEGSLTVVSQYGTGTTFTVTLPKIKVVETAECKAALHCS